MPLKQRDLEGLTEEQKFFVERYDFIYRELNKIQDNMSKMEIETNKLLTELQALREKERQTFEENGEEIN
jgi:hypothetical protein